MKQSWNESLGLFWAYCPIIGITQKWVSSSGIISTAESITIAEYMSDDQEDFDEFDYYVADTLEDSADPIDRNNAVYICMHDCLDLDIEPSPLLLISKSLSSLYLILKDHTDTLVANLTKA